MPQEQMPERMSDDGLPLPETATLPMTGNVGRSEKVEQPPASRLSALAERVERAEALLRETVPIIMRDTECDHDQEGCRVCADNADLISRISALTTQKEKP